MKKIYVVKVYSDSMDERRYIDSYWSRRKDARKRMNLLEYSGWEGYTDVKAIVATSLINDKDQLK